jgi:hypothetical protein
MRYLVALRLPALFAALLTGIGVSVYAMYFHGEPPPVAPEFTDDGKKLSSQEEFDKLARENPVKMLGAALTRRQREVRGGSHFTLVKQERVKGEPKPPAMPVTEEIDVWVHGDVPDPETKKTSIEVLMKWKSGAKRFWGAEITGSLFSERPKAEGGLDGKVCTWRPKARFSALSVPLDPNIPMAQDQSRYCIRDAGLYRSMLRTHEAWAAHQAAGDFKFEYLGKKKIEQVGGRECHVIKRICPRVEIDSFELGGKASTDPKALAAEGFTEVTLFVDAERWLQLGSELYRTETDGTRVLIGAYYFRDVQLNPTIPPDTFTTAGLKK